MKNGLFAPCLIALGLVCLVYIVLAGGPAALLLTAVASSIFVVAFWYFADEKPLVINLFLISLLARLVFGLFVHIYDLREFFGGDAITYDYLGYELLQRWTDSVRIPDPTVDFALQNIANAWGMHHLVAAIYYLVGRNILAAQSVCCVIGAATAPMVYICTKMLFGNEKAAVRSALLVALFPAFITWSGQLLKDGPIVFLLALSMTMILKLQERFSFGALAVLGAACAGIMSLRFYVFYMVIAAIGASLVIGVSTSAKAVARNAVVVLLLGVVLTYIGVSRNASNAFERFANLSVISNSRQDLATSAGSGFGADLDVSTTEGALSAVPIGLAYLFLAPFPWQISSLRAGITVPEVLVWWLMIPVLVSGVAWSVKHHFKKTFPILVFALLLSLAYSILQGNVGTAYRQRTQIQVFCFIFIAVGWTLREEKRENKRILMAAKSTVLQRPQRLATD